MATEVTVTAMVTDTAENRMQRMQHHIMGWRILLRESSGASSEKKSIARQNCCKQIEGQKNLK